MVPTPSGLSRRTATGPGRDPVQTVDLRRRQRLDAQDGGRADERPGTGGSITAAGLRQRVCGDPASVRHRSGPVRGVWTCELSTRSGAGAWRTANPAGAFAVRRRRPEASTGHAEWPIPTPDAPESPSASATPRRLARKWPIPTPYGPGNLSPSATTKPGCRHRPQPVLPPSATTRRAGRDRSRAAGCRKVADPDAVRPRKPVAIGHNQAGVSRSATTGPVPIGHNQACGSRSATTRPAAERISSTPWCRGRWHHGSELIWVTPAQPSPALRWAGTLATRVRRREPTCSPRTATAWSTPRRGRTAASAPSRRSAPGRRSAAATAG